MKVSGRFLTEWFVDYVACGKRKLIRTNLFFQTLFAKSLSISLSRFFLSLSHGVDGFRNVAIFHPVMVTGFLSAL